MNCLQTQQWMALFSSFMAIILFKIYEIPSISKSLNNIKNQINLPDIFAF